MLSPIASSVKQFPGQNQHTAFKSHATLCQNWLPVDSKLNVQNPTKRLLSTLANLVAFAKEANFFMKEVCHARDSQNWLIRVESSALVTGFVLAEGTHQTRCLFGELHLI